MRQPCPAPRTGRQARVWLCGLTLAFAVTGCLSPTYVIPPGEISRIAQQPANMRGQRLRVVQRFLTADEPPVRSGWSAPPPATPGAPLGVSPPPGYGDGPYVYPHFYFQLGDPSFGPLGLHGGPPRGAIVGKAAASAPNTPGPTSAGLPSGGLPSNTDTEAMIIAAVVAGVGVGIGLAATEGARYDGWVAVHPEHPVHLMSPGGRSRLVPLSHLSPAAVLPGEEAVIRRDQGIGLWELGRAPLSREGFCYGFGMGRLELPVAHYGRVGLTSGQFELGYFPSQHVGLLGSIALGWGSTDLGGLATVVTPTFEVQLIPIRLWLVHLGLFGQIGRSWATTDGGDLPFADSAVPVLGGGLIMQWDITTRLAMTFRWGSSWRMLSAAEPTTQQFTIGMTIY